MNKFFRLLYYYGLGLFVAFVVFMSVVMYLSPRQDAKKRGFIPCTEELVYNITSCEQGKMSCPLKYLWQDMKCNVRVVLSGFGAWIKGKQTSPWENYLFTPISEAEQDGIVMDELVYDNMTKEELSAAFIEARKKELDEAKKRKLNIDEEVLLDNPEDLQQISDDVNDIYSENSYSGASDDISDEAFMENVARTSDENDNVTESKSKNVIENLRDITRQKLNKGVKNEK